MSRLPALLVLACATSALVPPLPPMPIGAPLICFPIDIGEGQSLPVDASLRGPAKDGSLTLDRLPAEARRHLAASVDPQLHMETVRRAALWAEGAREEAGGKAGTATATAIWKALVDELEVATLASAAAPACANTKLDPAARTRQALVWFDLGYALATGRQLGFSDRDDGPDYLDKASELALDDLALHFGLALASFEPGSRKAGGRTADQAERTCYEHLALALKSNEPRLERNLLKTFGVFLQCETHDQLLAKVRGKLGGA